MHPSARGIVLRGAVLLVAAGVWAAACSDPEAFKQRPGLGGAGLGGSTGGGEGGTTIAHGGAGGEAGTTPTGGVAGTIDPTGVAGGTAGGGGQTSMGADASAGAAGGGAGGTAGGAAGTTGSAQDGGAAGSAAGAAGGGAAGAAGVTGAAGAPMDAGGGATSEYTGIVATSSSNELNKGHADPKFAVDGMMTTRWSSGYTDNEWLTLDLGATKQVSRVTIYWEAAYGKAFNIRVSKDNVTWTTLRAMTGGVGGTDDLTSLAGSGRYVQMQGVTRGLPAYGYSIWEMQVYGTTP